MASSEAQSPNSQRAKIVVAVLCSAFAILSLSSLRLPVEKSLTYDEIYYFNSGIAILTGQPYERGVQGIQERNVMPASALHVVASRLVPRWVTEKVTGRADSIFFGKLATLAAAILLAVYVYRWAGELYGLGAGVLAVVVTVLDPTVIAHSRVIHQDLISGCAIFVAVFYFWRFLRLGGRRNAVLSVVTFAIAQTTRHSALYLFPIYALLAIGFHFPAIVESFRSRRFLAMGAGLRSSSIYGAALLFGTILAVNLGFSFEGTFTRLKDFRFQSPDLVRMQEHPLLGSVPMPVPYSYVQGLDLAKLKQDSGFGSGPPYLLGRLGSDNGRLEGFKSYYMAAFAFKLPIATLLLILASIAVALRNIHGRSFWQRESFLIVPAAFYFTTHSLFVTAQPGIRYVLMVFPFLFTLCGAVAPDRRRSHKAYRAGVVVLLAYLLASNLSYFPHYLSYFNELVTDRKLSYRVLADSNLDWGQNEHYLRAYLARNPSAVVHPLIPQAGRIVVSANALVGITVGPELYRWIRDTGLDPVDHVAYSYLVFDIRPEDLQR